LKIESNIKKKYLIFFSIFIILIGSIFVLGGYDEYGHTASEIGPGTIIGPITVLTPIGDGDGLKAVTQTNGMSAIYGFVPEGYSAYSGFFEGGNVVIYDKKLLFKNEETIIERSTVSVGIEGTNLVFEDGVVGQKTLSELAEGGGSSFWASCTGGICYSDGNVGIGTTTPNQKFVLSNGRLSIQGSSPAPQIELYDSGTDGRDFTIISDEGLFKIQDDTAGENRFVIDSDGNIHVGRIIGEIYSESGVFANGLVWCDGGISDVTTTDFRCNYPKVNWFVGSTYQQSGALYSGTWDDDEGAAACFALGARYSGINVGYGGSGYALKLDSTATAWVGINDERSEYIVCNFI